MEILLGVLLGAFTVFLWLNKFRIENAKLTTKLKEQTESKEQINDTFAKLSAEVLQKNNADLNEKNADLLNPLKTQIEEFRRKIEGLSDEQLKGRSALEQQIKTLTTAHENTLDGAQKLTNALTYNNKQQGDWGEMVLESILQDSGLNKNQQYHVQPTLKDNNDKILRPDVIVHLPNNKDIIIDSKVSLKSYQDYIAGNKEAINAHIKSIDTHIKNISLKSYENSQGVNTLDYIFVFFPIEASLLVVLDKKPDLFNNALKKNIALVSPSTLMMSLKTVRHIWNTERQNQNTEEIVRQAEAMYDKFYGFVQSMDKIEEQLDKAKNSYQDARNKLSNGKGNLISRAEKLKTLGVQPKKELIK